MFRKESHLSQRLWSGKPISYHDHPWHLLWIRNAKGALQFAKLVSHCGGLPAHICLCSEHAESLTRSHTEFAVTCPTLLNEEQHFKNIASIAVCTWSCVETETVLGSEGQGPTEFVTAAQKPVPDDLIYLPASLESPFVTRVWPQSMNIMAAMAGLLAHFLTWSAGKVGIGISTCQFWKLWAQGKVLYILPAPWGQSLSGGARTQASEEQDTRLSSTMTGCIPEDCLNPLPVEGDLYNAEDKTHIGLL